MFKEWIFRLGSSPKRSMKRFFIGLALFAFGASLIALGYLYWPWLQLPGVIILLPGGYFAAWGYAGIFANRFAQVLDRKALDPSLFDNEDPK